MPSLVSVATALLGVGIAALFFRFGPDLAQLLDLPLDPPPDRKHNNAIDGAIEAWFNRFVGIPPDTAAAVSRARREEWWKATAHPAAGARREGVREVRALDGGQETGPREQAHVGLR